MLEETTQILKDRPLAYSYVRFSTERQRLGDSLRRQVELAETYCLKANLNLQAVSYQDLGVSAFKRKNIEKGALAAFILAVENGAVPRGSFLIIEQFDRLSRADIDVALMLLLKLVNYGISVVTVNDEMVWDKAACGNLVKLILAIMQMGQANGESVKKAERLETAWDQKKLRALKSGEILTRECPRWLSVNADKSAFIVLEDRVESIRKAFAMRNSGFGIVAIVRRANQEAWPAPGKGSTWHTSLVGRLFANRSLLGEYHPKKNAEAVRKAAEKAGLPGPKADPDTGEFDANRIAYGEPVMGYYPAVLDESVFLGALAKQERTGRFPGRRDVNYRNFLQGLLQCTCGKSFVRKNKTSVKQVGYARYYCTGRHRGLSDCPSVSASEIEAAVISAVVNIVPQFFDGADRMERLKEQADLLRLDLAAANDKRNRFADAVGMPGAPTKVLLPRLNEAQAEVEAIEQRLSATRAEAADLGGDSDQIFENIAKAINNPESIDARAQLREDLGRVLNKCTIDARANIVHIHIRGDDVPVTVPLNVSAVLPGIEMTLMSQDEHEKVFGVDDTRPGQ